MDHSRRNSVPPLIGLNHNDTPMLRRPRLTSIVPQFLQICRRFVIALFPLLCRRLVMTSLPYFQKLKKPIIPEVTCSPTSPVSKIAYLVNGPPSVSRLVHRPPPVYKRGPLWTRRPQQTDTALLDSSNMATSFIKDFLFDFDDFPPLSLYTGRIALDYVDDKFEIDIPKKAKPLEKTPLKLISSPRLNQTLKPLPPSTPTGPSQPGTQVAPKFTVRLPGQKKIPSS